MKEANKPLKILIADDDSDDLGFLNFLFQHHNSFEVIGLARSGEHVLDEILNKKIQPDILLIDRYMPTLTGTETVEKLWEAAAIPNANIFIISSIINIEEQERLKQYPRINFLAKPVTLQEINELPDKMLGKMNIKSPNII